jgi:TRAP-type C4-dicarboxylate transport system permease small subunit
MNNLILILAIIGAAFILSGSIIIWHFAMIDPSIGIPEKVLLSIFVIGSIFMMFAYFITKISQNIDK